MYIHVLAYRQVMCVCVCVCACMRACMGVCVRVFMCALCDYDTCVFGAGAL